MEPNFGDDSDCGNLFDEIDDLIEFPLDSERADGNLVSVVDCKDFPDVWSENVFSDCDPFFSSSHVDSSPDIFAELPVPYEDIVQLEWISSLTEDSFSGGEITTAKENLWANKEQSFENQYQISSPVSELESSSSSSSSDSGGKTVPLKSTHHSPQHARSKRPQPETFIPQPTVQHVSHSSSTVDTTPIAPALSSESDNSSESFPVTKSKKIKVLSARPTSANHTHPGQVVRKCLHCGITDTPQWRAGPMGPKTLCNACGVRYKSGRLFPEYRPAASPTFVPSLHSNSHRKVIEMRSKVGPGSGPSETTPKTEPVLVPNPPVQH